MKTNPYNVSYTDGDHFVAFLDILGFKNLVDQHSTKTISSYFNNVIEELNDLKMQTGKSGMNSVLISDSIVLSLSADQGTSALQNILASVAKIQYRLALESIWLRGAISMGKIQFSRHEGYQIVVGPALSNAYALEAKAITPRVIVDPQILTRLGMTRRELLLQTNLKDKSDWSDDLVYDDDEATFIPGATGMTDALFVDYFDRIGRIETKSRDFEKIYKALKNSLYGPQEHYPKHKWTADYFKSKLIGKNKEIEEAFYAL